MTKKIFTIFLFSFITCFLFLSFSLNVFAETSTTREVKPTLSVEIPGVNLEAVTLEDAKEVGVPWMGQYIAGIYKYLISIVATLAAVVMMYGGVLRIVSRGNRSSIGESNAWIGAALSGLVMALTSYTLLYYINPDLVKFSPISVTKIKDVEVILGDLPPTATNYISPSTSDYTQVAGYIGVACDGSLTPAQFAEQTLGKLDYSMDYRGRQIGSKTYMDCSSYAQLLAKCTNVPNVPSVAWTGWMFDNPATEDAPPGPESLTPGDLVGFPAKGGKPGHVWTYIGNNKFVECQGGKCVNIQSSYAKIKSKSAQKGFPTLRLMRNSNCSPK